MGKSLDDISHGFLPLVPVDMVILPRPEADTAFPQRGVDKTCLPELCLKLPRLHQKASGTISNQGGRFDLLALAEAGDLTKCSKQLLNQIFQAVQVTSFLNSDFLISDLKHALLGSGAIWKPPTLV
jgi:hypothetical protein